MLLYDTAFLLLLALLLLLSFLLQVPFQRFHLGSLLLEVLIHLLFVFLLYLLFACSLLGLFGLLGLVLLLLPLRNYLADSLIILLFLFLSKLLALAYLPGSLHFSLSLLVDFLLNGNHILLQPHIPFLIPLLKLSKHLLLLLDLHLLAS